VAWIVRPAVFQTVAQPDTPPQLHLTISVLGPVRAHRDDRPIVLGGRRQRGVLARLAIAAGHVVPTDRLIDDIWAGEPPASAANTLQSYVSNLRKALGGSAPVIERVGDGYWLSTETASLTTERFERRVDDALRDATPTLDRIAHLDEALALWDGAALGDLADEPWAKGEAVRLDELRLAAIEERFRLLLELGRHATVVGELAAAVDAYPLRERLAEQLVLALYRCGRQPEALQAYEATREHLAEELGLDPSPELVRLAEAVAGRDPSLDLATHAPTAPAAPPARRGTVEMATKVVTTPGPIDLPPAVTERRQRSTFVGRDRELAALERSWQAVGAGDRRLVTISGEPGMGKTRLAQVFCQRVYDGGGHVLWGRCTAENLVAYQPAAEALRTALRSVNPEILSSIVDPRPALRLLLPAEDATLPAETATDASRYDLYEALVEVLGDVASSSPILYVIDDVQWADRSTLALVEHLIRQDRTGRLLVLGTIRRPAGRATPDLDRWVNDLRRDDRVDQIELGGMSTDDVAQLLAGRGVDDASTVAESLRQRTGGNPYFLESLAEHDADLAQLGSRDLPSSVRDLIDQRVDALDPEVARVLTAASVIGMRVDLDLLAAVTDLDIDALLDVVDVAVEAALLVEDEDIGWVTFPHALVRHGLLARTTRNREAQLNLRVADALEQGGGPDRDLAIAQHLANAGRLCPPPRAAGAALRAARSALARSSDDEGRTWARRAAEAVAALDDDEAWQLTAAARLLEAEADRRLGEVASAQATLDQVIAEARHRSDARVLAQAAQERCLAIAGVGFAFGTVDLELLELLDEALGLVPEDRAADRTSLLAWSSIARNSTADKPQQRSLAERAVAGAREQPTRPDLLALALLAERLAHATPDGLEHRLEVGPEMGAAAAEAGWSDLIVVGMVLDVVDLLESGDAQAARSRIEDLESYIVPFGRPLYDAYHLFLAAAVAQMEGRHADAEALSAKANDLGETSHADNARHARAGQLFVLARDLGTVGELKPLTGAMVDEYPTMAVWLTGHATACAAAGDLTAARTACGQVFAPGVLEAVDSTWTTSLAQLAEVCWMLEEPAWCARLAQLLEPLADRMAVTGMGAVCLGSLQRPLALARDGAGDLDGAITAIDRAVAVSEDQGIDLWLARSLAERSLLLERRGEPGDAEQVEADRVRAHELADRLGIRLALGPTEYPAPRRSP
jgi:DNA-binding SARP family transcriptional activator